MIAAIIPPRERGRYNGYLGAVMAVATVGGPLLGGLIVDVPWLGWRWCFFVGVPIAVLAFVVLQRTLKLPTVRRDDVHVDYLGAALIAAGVSVLLIWVSFVGNSFDWLSWQTGRWSAAGWCCSAIAVLVESRVREPVVPLKIVVQRTPALAIIASLAVGMAMFGGAVFLGQYFQIGRGYSPTEAGLLTIPMMAGVLVSSTVSGRMISRTGVIKPYIVTGTVVLVLGFLGLGMVDHATSLCARRRRDGGRRRRRRHDHAEPRAGGAEQRAAARPRRGERVGDVLPLARRHDRRLGARRGARQPGHRRPRPPRCGGPADLGAGDASALNLDALPPEVQQVVHTVYGDATAHIFLISAAAAAVVGVVAALLLKPITLRTTIDLEKKDEQAVSDPIVG